MKWEVPVFWAEVGLPKVRNYKEKLLMISILSPAKKLNFEKIHRNCEASQPIFKKQATKLAEIVAQLDISELSKLMKISSNLATLNKKRFDQFSTDPSPKNSKQAAFVFAGDTYVGLSANEINPENDTFFQNNIRILSGLYGILRPFDLIQPYRLEMGSRLQTEEGSNLYKFWNNALATTLETDLKSHTNKVLINLASEEYFKAINFSKNNLKVITPKFFEIRNGDYKLISFFAKKARGLMARFIVNNKLTEPEDIKDFNLEGYKFESKANDDKNYIFSRKSD